MNYKKLDIAISIVLVLLVTYFTISFMSDAKKDFFVLQFEWDAESVTESFGVVAIDSVSDNYISLEMDVDKGTHPYFTYKLSDGNDKFYFRYVYRLIADNTIIFKGVQWLNQIPSSSREYSLSETNIPLQEVDGPNVVTIGDKQIYQNEAKYYRRKIKTLLDVNFVGIDKDVFGVPYVDLKEITSDKFDSIENVDFYVLFLPRDENALELVNNLNQFLKKHLHKNASGNLIIISIPGYSNVNEANRKGINNKFQKLAKSYKAIRFIDTEELLGVNNPLFYRLEGDELSKEGYEKLAEKTVHFIEE